jgi:hypothetical protein
MTLPLCARCKQPVPVEADPSDVVLHADCNRAAHDEAIARLSRRRSLVEQFRASDKPIHARHRIALEQRRAERLQPSEEPVPAPPLVSRNPTPQVIFLARIIRQHGPQTCKDLARWSGRDRADVDRTLLANPHLFVHEADGWHLTSEGFRISGKEENS